MRGFPAANAMGPLLLQLSTLLGGVGLMVVGIGLLFSVLGLRASASQFSSMALGLATSAYFVGFVLGTYVCPMMIRRVGHIRAFAAMASLASTMPILHALWVDPWFWGLLRLVTGVCMAGLYIAVESWLNALAPSALRGRLFAVYMAINYIALALGQWLILVGDKLGFVPFAMVSVMFSFALLPITMTPVDEPEPVDAPTLSLRSLYDASPMGTAAALCSGVVSGSFYGLAASFAQGAGLGDGAVASFMAMTILGGALFQWPVGHFSDTHDRRIVLMWVCLIGAGVCGFGFVLSGLAPQWLIALAPFFGGMVFAIYGLGVAHVNDVIDSSRLVEFTGGLLLVHGVGAALGPAVAGVVMDQAGSASLMLCFAAALGALALYTLKRLGAAKPVPTEDKAQFVFMGGGSQAVLQMDPRQTDAPATEGADASVSAAAATATEAAPASTDGGPAPQGPRPD